MSFFLYSDVHGIYGPFEDVESAIDDLIGCIGFESFRIDTEGFKKIPIPKNPQVLHTIVSLE